jgi:hypothetical protein
LFEEHFIYKAGNSREGQSVLLLGEYQGESATKALPPMGTTACNKLIAKINKHLQVVKNASDKVKCGADEDLGPDGITLEALSGGAWSERAEIVKRYMHSKDPKMVKVPFGLWFCAPELQKYLVMEEIPYRKPANPNQAKNTVNFNAEERRRSVKCF